MSILPTTKKFGEIKTIKVLEYYNQPILFVGESDFDQKLLCMLVSDELDKIQWLVVTISNDRLEELTNGLIDYRTTFTEAESNYANLIVIDQSNFTINSEVEIPSSSLSDDLLPEPNVYVENEISFDQHTIENVQSEGRGFLRLHFNFPETKPGEAPIGMLGEILTSLQSLINSIGQSLFGKPKVKGAVPTTIRRNLIQNLVSTSPGSTVVNIQASQAEDLLEENTKAIINLIDLIDATPDIEGLTQKLRELQVRVASNYLSFLKSIESQERSIVAEYISPKKMWISARLTGPDITEAIRVIKHIDFLPPADLKVRGTLMGLSLDRNWFEIHEDLEDGIREIKGRFEEELRQKLVGTKVGLKYEFSLRQVSRINQAKDEVEEVYELLDLKEL
ncbi:MAG TPA: hypothetical protein PLO13_01320 [Anaerolineaceae bacterium]|nr:hypothetical protein [Anaerolineaceae bacterium]